MFCSVLFYFVCGVVRFGVAACLGDDRGSCRLVGPDVRTGRAEAGKEGSLERARRSPVVS